MKKPLSIRLSDESRDLFESMFLQSGLASKEDFINLLLKGFKPANVKKQFKADCIIFGSIEAPIILAESFDEAKEAFKITYPGAKLLSIVEMVIP